MKRSESSKNGKRIRGRGGGDNSIFLFWQEIVKMMRFWYKAAAAALDSFLSSLEVASSSSPAFVPSVACLNFLQRLTVELTFVYSTSYN